ncbi:MAG: tetratricopeptide repeat protein [Candidatus Omnitrophota bacterium]
MKTKLGAIIIIFFLALAVRAIYLEQIKNTTLFSNPISDSRDYHRAGMKLAGGTITKAEREKFFRIPLYHNFLKVIYRTVGPGAYFSSLVQLLIGSASCCLIYLLGKNAFSERVGILAGIIASFYWPFAAFAAKTLPVNLAIFFSLLSLLALYGLRGKAKWIWAYASGAFLAFSCLTRPNFLLLFPFLALWVLFYFFRKMRALKSILCSAVFVLGFVSVILPAGLMDYSARKEFVPIQKNYAATAYMGTDLELIDLRPGYAWRKKMLEMLRMDLTSRKERDLYWLGEIKKLIAEDPAGYFRSFLKKMYVLLNYYEFAPYESINYFREKSPFLSVLLLNFGSIAAFSIFGMLLAWGSYKREAAPIYLFAGLYFLALLPFPPLARYRLPLVPFLIVFASYCMLDFFDAAREKRWGYLSLCAVLFLPVFILTNTNPTVASLKNYSRPYYHEGRAYLAEGETGKALASLERALYMRPNDADIYEALGDVFFQRGDLKKAEMSYKKALEIESDFPEALEKLGVVYGRQGDLDKAIATFKQVLSSFPVEYASTHINLATCYSLKGDKERARRELERALELDPEDPRALYKLTELNKEQK